MLTKNGAFRYLVRDVNHHSKTDGMKGYITGNWNAVRPVYYQSKPKLITVLNPGGINEYRNKDLTGKVKTFKQGTQLKVTGLVKHNLTTRFVLNNGHYVTGNRKLVITGKYAQPKRIKLIKSIYRYHDVNLDKRHKLLKKGTTLTIKRWAYSQPHSLGSYGTKRYAVSGGWITANPKFIKVIK